MAETEEEEDLLLEPHVLQCAQHFDQTGVVAWLRQLRSA